MRARLWRHHLPTGILSLGLLLLTFYLVESPDSRYRWSMASAYVGLGLLGATLLTGPLDLLRGRKPAVSTDLRRDLGIWSAIVGLLHVVIGLQVHMGNPLLYFFHERAYPERLVLRGDLFGFGNYTGLLATFLLALLAALSNDRSLKRLGSRRWKGLQRWNYGLFALVVLHGIAYQVIENRPPGYSVLFGCMTGIVVVTQAAGFLRKKRQGVSGAERA